jgi:hypothetical protein
VQRSTRYDLHVVPNTVKGILTSRLPSMQNAFAAAAENQQAIQALAQGILSGYSIPLYQYARWYTFAMQVDKLKRRFSGSPGLSDELANLTSLWIARGYNVVILDLLRDAVLAYNTTWSISTGYDPTFGDVNSISGHAAFGSMSDKHVAFIDPVTRSVRLAITTTSMLMTSKWCAELNLLCGVEDYADDVIARINETSLVVDEFPVSAGDHPVSTAVDYDPTFYGGTVKGKYWVACMGNAKCYCCDLIGPTSPTAITLPTAVFAIALDTAHNCVYFGSMGTAAIYAVDRSTHAVTTYTPPFAPGDLKLDATNHKLWISSDPSSAKVCQMDTVSHVFSTVVTLTDNGPLLAIDPIRFQAYASQNTAGTLVRIDGATLGTSNIPASHAITDLAIDPSGCQLLWTDHSASLVGKAHLTSGYTQTYALPDAYYIAASPTNHRFYVSRRGSTDLVTCIMP